MINFKEKIQENRRNDFNVLETFKNMSVDEIKLHQPKMGFAFCAINILGDTNLGMLLRSAVLFGADKFFIAGRKRYDKRTTVGAENYIDIENIPSYNIETDFTDYDLIFNTIRQQGYSVVCCENGGNNINNFKCDTKPCFIVGSEGYGIPKEVLNKADAFVQIEQFGVMRSFNVAVAGSIIMYEYTKV